MTSVTGVRIPDDLCPSTHNDRTWRNTVQGGSPLDPPAMSSVEIPAIHTTVPESSDVALLRARVDELTRERDQLAAAVDILQEVSSSLHFTEILQRIAQRLGDLFGLD